MDVGTDGDLHGVASIRCRTGSACLPLSSPRSWSRRLRCCSCGRRSVTRWCRRNREPTSVRPSWSGRPTFAPVNCGCSGPGPLVELGVLIAAVRLAPQAGRRPVLTGAATAVAITLTATAAVLPLRAASRQRAKDVGLDHAVVGRLGGRRGEVHGHLRRLRGGRRRADRVRDPALRPRLVGARRGAGRRLRARLHLPRPGRARPDVQQVHAAARRARPAPTSSSWRSRRASTSARSTRSTRHGAPPPPTPT